MTSMHDVVIMASKAIKKSFDDGLQAALEPYIYQLPFIETYTTSDWDEKYTSTEGLTGTKWLAEYEAPPTNKLEEGYEVIITPDKFGNGFQVSLDLMEKAKDRRTMIEEYLVRQTDKVIKEVKYFIVEHIFDYLNNAFNTAHIAPDGVELCGTHSYRSGQTFTNFFNQAFNEAAVDAVVEYAGAFLTADGKEQPINLDTIICKKGSAVAKEAKKLFAFDISPTKVGDINIYQGVYNIIEVPYIKSANKEYWFMIDSTAEPSIKLGFNMFPTLGTPQVQKDLSIYTPVVGFMKSGIVKLPTEWVGGHA